MIYNITLEILGQKWRSKGSSIEDALNNIDLTWDKIPGKGTVTIYKGSKKHVHLYNGIKLRRIFSNKIVKMQQSKFLAMLLKEGNKTNIPVSMKLNKLKE